MISNDMIPKRIPSVREKIGNGTYRNNNPYPQQYHITAKGKWAKVFCPNSNFDTERAFWKKRTNDLIELFKIDAFEEVGLTYHPHAQMIWNLANKRSETLNEIMDRLEEFAELLECCRTGIEQHEMDGTKTGRYDHRSTIST